MIKAKSESIDWLQSPNENTKLSDDLVVNDSKRTSLISTFIPFQILNFIWTYINDLTFITICSFLTLWSSAFIYLTFYYVYIPIVFHTRSINFKFDSRCMQNCFNPYAEVALSDYRTPSIFVIGQQYKFTIDLDLPESDVNWKQGMFMVRLVILNEKGLETFNSSTSTILIYKSPLLRIVSLICYWPLLVTGLKQESQKLSVILTDDYIDGVNPTIGQATKAQLSIEARNIQIYSANLKIEAQLSGLRHYMVYWPLTSAVLGTLSISLFLTIILICSFVRMLQSNQYPEREKSL